METSRDAWAVTSAERAAGCDVTIGSATRLAVVLGHPVAHSRSPVMMNAAFAAAALDAVFLALDVPPAELAACVAGLRAMRALGASVTVPHKQEVGALCDELAPAAAAIGAVNCLQLRAGRVIGHNTDSGGLADALVAAGAPTAGARCVVLGGGGAARAVAHGLATLGVARTIVVARTACTWAAHVPWSAPALAAAFSAADVVIDCTSIALQPDGEAAHVDPLPLAALRPAAWVGSLVYHRVPLLLTRAAAAGHRTFDGAEMLVRQGARAYELWTDTAAPIDAMRAALCASILMKNA